MNRQVGMGQIPAKQRGRKGHTQEGGTGKKLKGEKDNMRRQGRVGKWGWREGQER